MMYDIKKIEHEINNTDNIILEPSKKYKNHICVTNDKLNELAFSTINRKIDTVTFIPYKQGNRWTVKEMKLDKDILMIPINLYLMYGKAYYNQKSKVLELHIDVKHILKDYRNLEEDKLKYMIKKEILKSITGVKEVLEFLDKHY